METDLGYNEGEFLCLMLGDGLRHQQASAQAIQSGTCRGDAETSWTNVVSAPLFHLPSLLTELGPHSQCHCPGFSCGLQIVDNSDPKFSSHLPLLLQLF